MATWLMNNFIWLAIIIVFIVIGAKVVLAHFLKKLMDDSTQKNMNDKQQALKKDLD